MTQRYKITTHITPTFSGGYDTVAIAVPDDQGDFVQYGAVAHLIEEKTIEQHREEFDGLCRKHGLRAGFNVDSGLFDSHVVGWMWQSWKAAKGIKE